MQIEIPSWFSRINQKEESFLRVKKIDSLTEIPTSLEGTVIVDLDGVLCCRGKKNNPIENTRRVMNLLRIVGEADEVIFSTARFEIGKKGKNIKKDKKKENGFSELVAEETAVKKRQKHAVLHCPFIDEKSIDFLNDLVLRKNPNCSVAFDATIKKYVAKNEKTLSLAEAALSRGEEVSMIGSGLFDERVAKKIARNGSGFLGRITLYNLGNGLI